MTTKPDAVAILPCEDCERFHTIEVRLLDEPFGEASYTIPAHCGCGAALDTPSHRADVLDTAAHLMQAGY